MEITLFPLDFSSFWTTSKHSSYTYDRVQDWCNKADLFSIPSIYLEKYFILTWILLWNLAEKSLSEFETVKIIWKILKWNKVANKSRTIPFSLLSHEAQPHHAPVSQG